MWIWLFVSSVIIVNGAAEGGGESGCPPCPPCPPGGGGECEPRGGVRDECFYWVGGGEVVLQAAGGYFLLRCPPRGAPALGAPGLPALGAPRGAPRTVLQRCRPPPPPLTVAAALGRLNVTVLDELVVSGLPAPAGAALGAHLLRGLRRLRRLVLAAAAGAGAERPEPASPALLSPLSSLTHLQISAIPLLPAALLSLPPLLESLLLSHCYLSHIPPEALSRLTRLQRLNIDDPLLVIPPDLSLPPSLSSVLISAPLPSAPPLHTVINATLSGILELHLSSGCGSLQQLNVMAAPVMGLEGGWLPGREGGQCGALTELRLMSLPSLSHVHERALEGASALQSLTLSRCFHLRSLPRTLLLGSRNIRTLDLSRNQLTALPDELLSPLSSLQFLDLSNNALGPAVVGTLGALVGLRELRLGENPLGDLCPSQDDEDYGHIVASRSQLSPLTMLRTLSLSNTGAVRVCTDWRQQLRALTSLQLRDNNITLLEGKELQWRWEGQGEVDLRGNPVGGVVLRRGEYGALREEEGEREAVTLLLEAVFPCGCGQYWAARAARERRLGVRLEGARCRQAGRPVDLAEADLTLMVCEASEQCAADCSCQWRPLDDTLLADCSAASAVPVFPVPAASDVTAARLWLRLRVHGAGDSGAVALSAAALAALPAQQRVIDLSSNSLRRAAHILTAANTNANLTVRLRDNPLHCDCTEITALYTHRNMIADFDSVTCRDGELVSSFQPEKQCRSLGAVLGAVVGVAALLTAVGTVAARRQLRARVKTLLRHRRRRRKLPRETNYLYDGFLAFSRHDWELAERVMEEMEDRRGLRLCVHWREWRGGEWLPQAIQRSVSSSRRTVALVSPHFVSAVWARAELREALGRAACGLGARPVLLLPGGRRGRRGAVPRALRGQAGHCRLLTVGQWERLYRLLAPSGPGPGPGPVPERTPAAARGLVAPGALGAGALADTGALH